MQKYTFPVYENKFEVLVHTSTVEIYSNEPNILEIKRLVGFSYQNCHFYGINGSAFNEQPTPENLLIVVGEPIAIMVKHKHAITRCIGSPNSFIKTSTTTFYGDLHPANMNQIFPGWELRTINAHPNNRFSLDPTDNVEIAVLFKNC